MKKAVITLFGIVAIGAILFVYYAITTEKKHPNTSNFFMEEYGMTNPEKRLERDLKMLADPATGKIPEGIRSKELAFAQNLPSQNSSSRGEGYNWKAQGPFNVGGRTRAAAVDINNDKIMIAGGNSGAIYRSVDGGQSWTKAETPYLSVGASCIAQDTRSGKTDTWYVGTGERYSSATGGVAVWLGNGVLKSMDNGLTWDTLSSTVSNSPQTYNEFDKIWGIVINPSSTIDEVYVATNGTIYKSIDGGTTWTATLSGSGTGAYSYADLICTPTGILYATFGSDGNKKGIWRSTDGDTWTSITPTAEIGTNFNRIVSCYDPQNENIIYFLANTPGKGKETFNYIGDSEWNSLLKYEYISGDGTGSGGIWTNLSENLPIGPYMFDDFNVQGSYDMLVRVKPDDSNTIIIGGTNLYRSSDGFTTATNTTQIGGYKEDTGLPLFEMYPNHHPDQHIVFFSPTNSNIMYSGNDGGLTKTTDINATTVVWESLNNGYITSQFYTVAIDHGTDGSNTIIGGLQDNGSQFTNSADGAANWTMSFSYDGAYCAIPDGADNYYMSVQSGRIVKLVLDETGNLTSYSRIDPIVSNPSVYDFINPFVLDPKDNNVMYLSVGKKLWRNNDLNNLLLNNVWDSITQGWTELSGTAAGNISAFGVTYSGSHTLFIGTENGRIYKVTEAATKDTTIQLISTGITGYVSSISVDPRDDNKIMVVVSNYNVESVFYSENGGTNWWRVAGNLEGKPTSTLAPETYFQGSYPSCRWGQIIPTQDGNTVYLLGTSVGLMATDRLVLGTDYFSDKTIWNLQSPDLIGNSVVTMIDYRASDGFTAVATHGAGVFTTNIKNTWLMADIREEKSANFRIYPNPANNYINVDYKNMEVLTNFIIYDIKGNSVKSDKVTKNNINISGLSKGQYIFELYSKDKKIVGTEKLIIQ